MADFIKRKIVEKLARFTKDLKPSDLSLNFLTGKGKLHNLELNAQFITEVLQLPPWIQISKVVCDEIRGRVPFTSLTTEPITFYVGTVTIEVSTCTNEGPRDSHSNLLKKIGGGKPTKYGFTEKVIDGMKVEIRCIVVRFQDPTFHAQLDMADIVIQSTAPDWTQAQSLKQTRYQIPDEDSIVIFKMASWSNLRLEGWSASSQGSKAEHHNSRIRLLSDNTKIRIAFKRNLSTNSVMATRISVFLGDIIWILTQSQLRVVSKLTQSLMQAAVKTAQAARLEKEKHDSDRESIDSMESTTSTASTATTTSVETGGGRHGDKGVSGKNQKKKSSTGGKSLSAKERAIKQRLYDYREGKYAVPHYEVIQDSFHLHSGKIEIQLCDDTEEALTAQGSMLLQLCQLVVDVYFDQPAGVGRAHWNEANDNTSKNAKWSRKLIQQASKTQFIDFPSIDLINLRERGVVIRCSDFSVSALKSDKSSEALPVITCDKKTFNIPDDVFNPAFQVGLTFYHYPLEYSEKFSAPRPNVFVYVSPLHINVDQRSCLWLVEFVYGVVKTVNMELAMSVHDEGKSYIESRKAESAETHQLPGVDAKIKILFMKVTIPLPGEVVVDDGRPKALQIETAAIIAKNRPLDSLLSNTHFKASVLSMKRGWVFETQDTNQFPHFPEDIQSLPSQLSELIHQAFQRDRKSVSSLDQRLSSEDERSRRLDLATMEGWHIHTECMQVSFAKSYSHEDTLRTTQFVDDFPVHLWLFLPRPDRDSTLSTFTPSTPSHSPQPHTSDPILSFIAHAPNVIRAELNRAQVLFLMRLKDSITMFKNRLMEFLDTSTFVPPKRTPSPSASSQTSSSDALKEESADDVKAMSGCVIVEHMQANILLPSIFTPVKSPTTPQTPVGEQVTHNDSTATVTNLSGPASGTTQTFSPLVNEKVVASSSLDSSNPVPSDSQAEVPPIPSSSLRVSPINPTHVSSSESLTDNEAYSVASLPVLSNPNPGPSRLYNSASDLADKRSSLDQDTKSLSSNSLSALSDTHSPSPLNTVDGSAKQTSQLSSESGSEAREPPPPFLPESGSETREPSWQCSDNDDFVMVEDPSKVRVTVSPPTEVPAKGGHKSRRRLKSPPPISERKVRSLSPPKNEPEYILCIKVDGIHALPNIRTSGEISARCNANSIDIREIKKDHYEAHKEDSRFKKQPQENKKCMHPVIKARVEVGDQVARFFPKSVTEADVILILKATGLNVGLLTQNMAVMKDFFDDEFESEQPVPIHVRVDNTKLVILDSPGDSIDHWKSVCVEVNQADIHRGRSLVEGANVFMDGGQTGEAQMERQSNSAEPDTGSPLKEPNETQSLEHQQSSNQLLTSFKSFIESFELHMKLHGHQAPLQPDHIAGVLAELQSSSQTDSPDNQPPSYSEAVSVMVTTHLQSASSESNSQMIKLRRENEVLRQLQSDREKLNTQLVNSQTKLEQQMNDLEMVTEECKKAKEELVVYKQVLERQQETLEKILSENFDLKKR